jgi:FAD/FMN-containing dehydrogenase
MAPGVSRREFARRSVTAAGGVAAAIAGAPACRSRPRIGSSVDGVRRDLAGLSGRLHFDEASREDAAEDFGHIVHRRPLAVLRPASTDDVVSLVRYANRHGLRVAMNGNRHSVYGQAQARDGVVIEAGDLNRIHAIGDDYADVDAGVTWGELAKATLARGLTPPVMTEFQDLSIGGTLSVGGVGPASHRFGAQVDHVLEFQVVTGTGERVTCSPDLRPELFDAVRAGFGQCGLIVRARVRLVHAPSHVLVQELDYRDMDAYLADASRVLQGGRFDHQLGHVIFEADGRPVFRLKVGRFSSGASVPTLADATAGLNFARASAPAVRTYWDELNRRTSVTRPAPRWHHPHATFYLFVPEKEIGRQLSLVLASPPDSEGARSPASFGVLPWQARNFTCPLFQVPRAADTFFALYLFRTAGDVASVTAMVGSNRVLYDRARAAGAKIYPVSAMPFTTADWKEHLGPVVWRRFAAAKHEFDPNGILTPGPAIFGSGD